MILNPNFEADGRDFSTLCRRAAEWKHTYFGAAYSTRIKGAVEDLKKAIQLAEDKLIDQ